MSAMKCILAEGVMIHMIKLFSIIIVLAIIYILTPKHTPRI